MSQSTPGEPSESSAGGTAAADAAVSQATPPADAGGLPGSPVGGDFDLYSAVKEVYSQYRISRFNVLYYGRKLSILQRWNLAIECAVAIGTSATLGSLPFASTEAGKAALLTFATIAAVLGVLKPILMLSKRIERATRLWTENNAAFNLLRRSVADIKVRHVLRPEVAAAVAAASERMDKLSADDDPNPSAKLLEKLQASVEREIPMSDLWWPEKKRAA